MKYQKQRGGLILIEILNSSKGQDWSAGHIVETPVSTVLINSSVVNYYEYVYIESFE